MPPIWLPGPERIRRARLTAFTHDFARETHRTFADYAALHVCSVQEPELFWAAMWRFGHIVGDPGERVLINADRMPGATFFPDARLNFSENLLQGDADALAIIAVSEDDVERRMTRGELTHDVRRFAAALEALGVKAGDRVAAIVANVPEAIVAVLGTAAIGAVWSSCSPDFGVQGVLDRFGQIEPSVLLCVDGYRYAGKHYGCLEKLAAVAAKLPSLERVITIPFAGDPSGARVDGAVEWCAFLESGDARRASRDEGWTRFPFNHPLYVLYSSGTTGVPKCIVHGAGNTLLQHLKEHQLHCDIHPGDRVFYFTTCGWMMWNWLVTVLASRATIVLYDGSALHPGPSHLFDLADRHQITLFGTSAKFIDAVRKSGFVPRTACGLGSIRTITSTGSPLAPESFDFVYASIKGDVHLASVSGGTDIVACFVGGVPTEPVWRGEIQAAELALDVQVFDDEGRAVVDEPGELVCTRPFPTMPLGFWNDPSGRKYHEAYFERFPNVWCHGDWTRRTEHGGFIIYGRSDATLKPGGVRIGTAEIYRQVEQLPEVLESLAVGQQWQNDDRIVLFVRLAPGVTLDDALKKKIADQIRRNATPRHVPAVIVAVADIPRTKSGKIVELAVRRVIHGRDVPNREALANPEALELYRDLPELRQ